VLAACCLLVVFFAYSSTLKTEAVYSSEASVYTISTRRHIPEEEIFHSHRRENHKFLMKKCSFIGVAINIKYFASSLNK
jgi:hypothetical protein